MTVRSLAAQQELQAVLDRFAIVALDMRIPRAEKREQRQSGDAGVGGLSRSLAILPQSFRFVSCAKVAGVPMSVRTLRRGEPG